MSLFIIWVWGKEEVKSLSILHRLYVSEAKCRKLYLYIIFIKVWQLLYFPQWPIGGGEIWLFSQEEKFEIFFSVYVIYYADDK